MFLLVGSCSDLKLDLSALSVVFLLVVLAFLVGGIVGSNDQPRNFIESRLVQCNRYSAMVRVGFISLILLILYLLLLYYVADSWVRHIPDTTLLAIISVPIAWVLWIWRNHDKQRTIEFGELTENTKNFLQLSETAADDTKPAALRIAAINGLQPFISESEKENFFKLAMSFMNVLNIGIAARKTPAAIKRKDAKSHLESKQIQFENFTNNHPSAADWYYGVGAGLLSPSDYAIKEGEEILIKCRELQTEFSRADLELEDLKRVQKCSYEMIYDSLAVIDKPIQKVGPLCLKELNSIDRDWGKIKIKTFFDFDFENAVIKNWNATEKVFKNCYFKNTFFESCSFINCTFFNCHFEITRFGEECRFKCTFDGGVMAGLKFLDVNADFYGSKFTNTPMPEITFHEKSMTPSYFQSLANKKNRSRK